MKSKSPPSCIARAFKLLAGRDHSVHELREKLAVRDYPENEINDAIAKLIGMGYLNDEKYCLSFAKGRVNRMKIGPRRLSAELSRKGFDADLINSVIGGIFGELESQFDVAMDAAIKKVKLLGRKTDADSAKRKVFDYLTRRGFSGETARRVVFDKWDELTGGKR